MVVGGNVSDVSEGLSRSATWRASAMSATADTRRIGRDAAGVAGGGEAWVSATTGTAA